MVSTQVTAFLGRRPDRKLVMAHVFSWKATVFKREVALGAGSGGCEMSARQGFCFTSVQLIPFLKAQHLPAYREL